MIGLAVFYAAAPDDMLGAGAAMAAYALGRRLAGTWGGAIAGASRTSRRPSA